MDAEQIADGETFAACFTLSNLLEASRKCMAGCGWKSRPQMFETRRLTECRKLQRRLFDGTYQLSPAARFRIMERGKPREVKSVDFRDRVVQRCLADHILIPAIERNISPNSSAVLKGRGLKAAYDSVRAMVAAAPVEGWVMQYDYSAFFAAIDHEVMKEELAAIIADQDALALLCMMVDSEDEGLELGSHVSQLCASYYPTPVDRALEHAALSYHRYMDDGVAVFSTRQEARDGLDLLRDEAAKIKLALSNKKTHINRVITPFVFCKLRFTKTAHGCRMNVTKRQSRRTVRHVKAVDAIGSVDMPPVVASCKGYLNQGDADLSRLVTNYES